MSLLNNDASLLEDLKSVFTTAGRYGELRKLVITAKRDAETYGQPGGGFNAFQFFMYSHYLDDYRKLYDKYLERRLSKLSPEQIEKLEYLNWYHRLEPEEQLAEQVKLMRRELDEVKHAAKM